MCGIAGIYTNRGHIEDATLLKMADCLAHRGPDGRGAYRDEKVGLVHNRLSIIDLSEQGNQPLYNEDKTLVLVCNGEIYNYRELRVDLIKKGHKFSSHSDSEVILHLYEDYRENIQGLLSCLTGMFAFALWDIRQQVLLVARDRLGIKPLYYAHTAQGITFASEVSAIFAAEDKQFNIDYTSLYEYFLLGSVPAPHTIYEGIQSLEPAHYLTFGSSGLLVNRYWSIPTQTVKWNSEAEVMEATEALLTDVIKDHLVADVPVGTFLSAGVDSSLITALAIKNHPGISSFTVSFPGEPEDEGAIATETARKLKTTHYSFNITENFFDGFQYHNRFMDQPFAISSALFLGQISRLAHQYVKVVLSGDGGDELFGGYDFRHKLGKFPSFFQYVPKVLGKMANKVMPDNSWIRLWKEYIKPEGPAYLPKMAMQQGGVPEMLFTKSIGLQIDKDRYVNRLQSIFESWDGDDQLNKKLYVDVQTSLVDEMLTKCDRMTMRNGIEGRVPFLDHRFVEHSFSIPATYKRNNTTGKLVMRKILEKHLGTELAFRDKTGFNSPLQQWLRDDAATKQFADKYISKVKQLSYINADFIDSIMANKKDNPRMVYALICLAYFVERE